MTRSKYVVTEVLVHIAYFVASVIISSTISSRANTSFVRTRCVRHIKTGQAN